MPLTQQQRQKLFAMLEDKGWFWDQGMIYSPHKIQYLNGEVPWINDFVDFRNRTIARLHRILLHKNYYPDEQSWHETVEDTSQLANTLEAMSEDGGLESFFAKIASPLNDFAETYGLKLTKYFCGSPCWDFTFRHPEGGIGKIEVLKESNESIAIYLIWWFDNYDQFIRLTKSSETRGLMLASINLKEKLKESLQAILIWKLNDLEENNNSYKKIWSRSSKEDFEKSTNEYPIPKI